MINCIKLY